MLKKKLSLIPDFIKQVSEDEIFMYAAQGAFYMITASIPFLMLLLALLKFIVPLSEKDVVAMVTAILPAVLSDLTETVMTELFAKSTAIISITGVTAMWSASRGVAAVERGIKKVYNVKKETNLFKDVFFSVFYTIMFIFALVASLLVMVFEGTIYNAACKYFGGALKIESFFGNVQWIMYFIGFFIFFVFVYKVLSGTDIRIREHIFGSLFATCGWFVFSFVFSVYVENFANYSYVYGSLSIIVLTMLWLYICMIILLLGAEINMFIKRKGWFHK